MVFSRFSRSGVGKKMLKNDRMLFGGRFGHFLANVCCFFGACQAPKHCSLIIYSGFVLLAWNKYVLQHGENCSNTSVFARHCPKKIVNIL